MTVVGATTADVASASYTPPFKPVTSYPAPVQVTGTITSINNNPTVPAGSSNQDYAWAYLQAHMMSTPSYRYAYLMWMIFALVALLCAAAHHLRLSRGPFGAVWTRFGMRRHTLGSKKPGAKNRALPSNGVIATIVIISIIALVLSVVGADYIVPTSSTLDFSTSFRKRATGASPGYTINKSLWTLGSRFGFMAFALVPLVVLLALKSPPIAILSLRPLTQLYADKLAAVHRAIAWLVWIMTTVHAVLWTIQLFEDRRNGKPTWLSLWTVYRFIFGAVAYGAMTALMVLSLRTIRKNSYEFFYIAHVVLVIVTLVCSAIHHPPLWYWMAVAGAIWALEKGFRYLRFSRVNALYHGRRTSPLQAGRPYSNVPANDNSYGMQDFKSPVDFSSPTRNDKTLPRVPGAETPGDWSAGESINKEFGGRSGLAYYDEGSFQPLGSYDARYADPYRTTGTTTPDTAEATLVGHGDPSSLKHHPYKPSVTAPPNPPLFTPPDIPVGYAQAQLLPSRTVRLTIRVPHPFVWSAGQSCLLYLPDLSRFQSHPFTILNNGEPEIVILVKARKGMTRRLFNFVRSCSLTAVGVPSVKDKRLSLASVRAGGERGMQVPPVHVRAWVDGPFGSACRVRWHEFASVVIICGGSGVSFGAAVCDYLCRMMSRNQLQGSRGVKTQRVRLCWVAREYAEIAWVAGQLYRCQKMVAAAQLQVSIYVTNTNKVRDDFAPPWPSFKAHARRDSQDSIASMASEMSVDSPFEIDDTLQSPAESSLHYADIVDLTNYDEEEDVNDPAEQHLSDRLQRQGKLQRAKSRKTGKGSSRGYPRSSGMASHHRQRSQMSMCDDDANYAAGSSGSQYDMLSPESSRLPYDTRPSAYPSRSSVRGGDPILDPPHPIVSPNDVRRRSFRSIADSTYGRYDPYGDDGPRGPSPGPSIVVDDNQSFAGESVHNLLSRASRTGSMVLLEDNGADTSGDAGLWIDEADYAAMNVMSEVAHSGKPKLSSVLREEIDAAAGNVIVATCGPVTLNTVVRNLVSKQMASKNGSGRRGQVSIYSEDYET